MHASPQLLPMKRAWDDEHPVLDDKASPSKDAKPCLTERAMLETAETLASLKYDKRAKMIRMDDRSFFIVPCVNGIAKIQKSLKQEAKVQALRAMLQDGSIAVTKEGEVHPDLGVSAFENSKPVNEKIAQRLFGGSVNPAKADRSLVKWLIDMGFTADGTRQATQYPSRLFHPSKYANQGVRLGPYGKMKDYNRPLIHRVESNKILRQLYFNSASVKVLEQHTRALKGQDTVTMDQIMQTAADMIDVAGELIVPTESIMMDTAVLAQYIEGVQKTSPYGRRSSERKARERSMFEF